MLANVLTYVKSSVLKFYIPQPVYHQSFLARSSTSYFILETGLLSWVYDPFERPFFFPSISAELRTRLFKPSLDLFDLIPDIPNLVFLFVDSSFDAFPKVIIPCGVALIAQLVEMRFLVREDRREFFESLFQVVDIGLHSFPPCRVLRGPFFPGTLLFLI